MLKKIALFLILFISFQIHAQNFFKGVVIEEDTSMTVTGAIVAIEGTAIAQDTDLNGAFMFTEKIPDGEHVITITKEGYVTGYFYIEAISGKNIIMNNIKIKVTKKESKRREKALKEQQKLEKKILKEREKTIANAKKEKAKRDKELEKKRKKLLKEKKKNSYSDDDDDDLIDDDLIYVENKTVEPVIEISDLQKKYGKILNVAPETITNIELYKFIEEWKGSPYLLGGENKEGVDCSSFTLRLYGAGYNKIIERTAQKQYDSDLTGKFGLIENLKEGDLVFFSDTGNHDDPITHVGLYLRNNYFVHSSSSTKGVAISSLEEPLWKRIFAAGGRRK